MMPLQWGVTALCRKKWQFGALFVWSDSPLLNKMVCQKAITICRGQSHTIRSLSRIVCRGQEHPKGRKDTLRPDFQANTRHWIFFKSQLSPQDKGRQLWGNPSIVSLRKFRDNEAWIQLGQESPLMNKKGLIYHNIVFFQSANFRLPARIQLVRIWNWSGHQEVWQSTVLW
jgi:hypothetical protein